MVAAGKHPLRKADNTSDRYKSTLVFPAPHIQGAFVNEMFEAERAYISRFQFVSQLPDGTDAGLDSEHELFSVQHQMKLVSIFLLISDVSCSPW